MLDMTGGAALLLLVLLAEASGQGKVVRRTKYTHQGAMKRELEELATDFPQLASTYTIGTSVEVSSSRLPLSPFSGQGAAGHQDRCGRPGEASSKVHH